MPMTIVISVDSAYGGSVRDDAWERNNATDNGISVTWCTSSPRWEPIDTDLIDSQRRHALNHTCVEQYYGL